MKSVKAREMEGRELWSQAKTMVHLLKVPEPGKQGAPHLSLLTFTFFPFHCQLILYLRKPFKILINIHAC